VFIQAITFTTQGHCPEGLASFRWTSLDEEGGEGSISGRADKAADPKSYIPASNPYYHGLLRLSPHKILW